MIIIIIIIIITIIIIIIIIINKEGDFRDSISKQSSVTPKNGFHMKITFIHLDTQKTPKTSDSRKPTLNKRSNKSPEFRQISAVITARPRLGTMYK